MNMKIKRIPMAQLRDLYDDIELAMLFDWLEVARPGSLRDIDIVADADSCDDNTGSVGLLADGDGRYGENALSNAIARLVLSGIQDRLPQWAAVYGDGRVELARAYTPKRRAKIGVLPRFLFEINWADSGPGFSWPESYHVAYLPGFDRYLVTASQDSLEMHGYTDAAIGHFPFTEAVAAGVHRVIVDWWQG